MIDCFETAHDFHWMSANVEASACTNVYGAGRSSNMGRCTGIPFSAILAPRVVTLPLHRFVMREASEIPNIDHHVRMILKVRRASVSKIYEL